MSDTMMPSTNEQRADARLEAKLDQVLAHVARLEARQRAIDELLELATPVLKVGLDGAVETFDELERAGYFGFGKALARVADRVVRGYSPDDVDRLGDQIVGILDTVRNLTQPDVMALVNDVASAVHDADDADPKGMWGLVRAGKDPEVRKGFGVVIGILKQVGHAANRLAKVSHDAPPVRLAAYADKDGAPRSWVRHLASRRTPAGPTAATRQDQVQARQPAASPRPTAGPAPTTPSAVGHPALPAGYRADGFIVDPTTWTREAGQALADLMPLALTPEHWRIIDWARAEYLANGASPNIRRVSVGAEVAIKDLYTLFPGKPGVLLAMLAGIPKPGGCL